MVGVADEIMDEKKRLYGGTRWFVVPWSISDECYSDFEVTHASYGDDCGSFDS